MELSGRRQQTYLFNPKSINNYGFRIRVPQDLQHVYDKQRNQTLAENL